MEQIFDDLHKFKDYSILFKSHVKSKTSKFFVVDHDIKILSFQELFKGRSFRERKLIELKTCNCISSTFPLSPLKVN